LTSGGETHSKKCCHLQEAAVVKPSKLYQRLLVTRASMRFRDFQRVLEAFGFTLDRIRGSHHNYRHRLVPRPLSIQPHGNMAKPYQLDQFLDMVEEFGLEIGE
jgi:predicted RNA binding protein YcfA (HicA-like mRNA interferase family)